jgi:Sigma-70 region 2
VKRRLAGTRLNRGDSVLAGYGWGVSVGGDHVVAGARGNGAIPRSRHAGTEGQGESARGTAAGAQIARADVAHAPRQGTQREEPPGPGDPAFHEYVTSRSGSLLRMAYLLTRNRADAEDLVQAALAKTYQAWDRIEDRGAVDGYVRRPW